MKALQSPLCAFLVCLLPMGAAAQAPVSDPAAACALEIEIQNLVPNKGRLQLAAYGSGETFFKKPAAATAREVGAETTMRITLCELTGEVSVIVYQDLNMNGKLDRNAVGIPAEPWGTSGSGSAFGPPTWDATKIPARGRVVISL